MTTKELAARILLTMPEDEIFKKVRVALWLLVIEGNQ